MKYIDLDRQCGLPKFDQFDVIGHVRKARDQLALAHHADQKIGTVRGGSVGAIIDGETYGECHRKAYLRYKGIETPLKPEIEVMTEAGHENETIWLRELREFYANELLKSLGPGFKATVKDQDAFECTWKTRTGSDGSGSPDVTIWNPSGVPVQGLELKNCGSITKAKATHYELKPPTKEVIQAANYSIRLGDQYCDGNPVPYRLIYSNRVMWHFFAMSDDNKRVFLEKGWDINYTFGKPMTVGCFHREYLIDWDIDGTVRYWTAGLKNWVKTGITRESIDLYYDVVSDKIEKNNTLGPRPTTKHIDGSKSYSPCNYCDFKSICDIGDRITPDEFVDRAQVLADEAWKQRTK